ncbi:MAG: hypothetical protein ACI3ZL_04120 [Candidatus Cryptobacteroides sp.]
MVKHHIEPGVITALKELVFFRNGVLDSRPGIFCGGTICFTEAYGTASISHPDALDRMLDTCPVLERSLSDFIGTGGGGSIDHPSVQTSCCSERYVVIPVTETGPGLTPSSFG